MGADFTEQRAEGKTAAEAYVAAVAEATAYYGHQEGYSGAINSKDGGFVLVALPPRMTYAKFQSLLEDADSLDGEYLAESIQWRKDILDNNKCKRSDRPAVRALMNADIKAQKQQKRDAAKFVARLQKSGFDEYKFQRYVEAYNDKWGAPLAVELSTREAKPSKRGRRVYVFFGYAPC